MKYLIKLVCKIFFFYLFIQNSYSDQNFKYVNIDLLVKETRVGSEMLSKINQIDQENIKKLNLFEEELRTLENEINMKKNIISEEEFNKEVSKLKSKLSIFNEEKNLLVKKLNDTKKNELKIFFDKINPIVQDYMNKNSIELLFNSKNLFIGNKKLDLTKKLIEEINNKF